MWAEKDKPTETESKEKKTESSSSSSSSSSGSSIDKTGNRLYFYSEVNRDKVLQLNKAIIETSREMKVLQINNSLKESPPIFLHINSMGGSVFAGLAAMDAIIRSDVPITTVIDGCAASAATFMSVVGSHRQINANAYMLIHQLTWGAWGKYEEILDHKENADELMKKGLEIYEKYTKIPQKQLKQMLRRDLWWDAKKCLKYGLVDEII